MWTSNHHGCPLLHMAGISNLEFDEAKKTMPMEFGENHWMVYPAIKRGNGKPFHLQMILQNPEKHPIYRGSFHEFPICSSIFPHVSRDLPIFKNRDFPASPPSAPRRVATAASSRRRFSSSARSMSLWWSVAWRKRIDPTHSLRRKISVI